MFILSFFFFYLITTCLTYLLISLFPVFAFLVFVFSYIFASLVPYSPFSCLSLYPCACLYSTAVDNVAVRLCVYQVGMSPADRYCHQRSGHIGSTAKGNQLNIPFRVDPRERYMACPDCTEPIIRCYMCVSCK